MPASVEGCGWFRIKKVTIVVLRHTRAMLLRPRLLQHPSRQSRAPRSDRDDEEVAAWMQRDLRPYLRI